MVVHIRIRNVCVEWRRNVFLSPEWVKFFVKRRGVGVVKFTWQRLGANCHVIITLKTRGAKIRTTEVN